MTSMIDSSRRRVLTGALGATALAPLSALSFAATSKPNDARFVFVILRGGLDGLYAVPAIGDPDFAPARGPLAQYEQAPLALSGPYALHPNLAQMHAMYGRGELAVLHAVGLPYRDRSHFDAQQVLESGGMRPYEIGTGWLARALAPTSTKSIALSTAGPVVLRGPGVVAPRAPSALPEPGPDPAARLAPAHANDARRATPP